ncbi:MAG: PaaI family thioesterase [Candidatus Thorarchaeota archaeon]
MNRNQQIIEDMITGKIPPPPIAELLKFKILDYCDGCTTLEMEIDEKYYNPMGTLHGGVMCDLADAAMGTSFFTTLQENESYTTVDLRINFLRPVKEGKIQAVAKIIKRGKRLGYLECEILNEEGDLVAKASSTCIILNY